MENATQALLIAGGILIAILIIGIFMNIFITYDKSAEGISGTLDARELSKYNANFIVFEGRKDVTAQEIVTLINLAKERDYEIKVLVTTKTGKIIKNKKDWTNETAKNINEFLSDHITYKEDAAGKNKNIFSYVEGSIDYDKEGRICTITFEENR